MSLLGRVSEPSLGCSGRTTRPRCPPCSGPPRCRIHSAFAVVMECKRNRVSPSFLARPALTLARPRILAARRLRGNRPRQSRVHETRVYFLGNHQILDHQTNHRHDGIREIPSKPILSGHVHPGILLARASAEPDGWACPRCQSAPQAAHRLPVPGTVCTSRICKFISKGSAPGGRAPCSCVAARLRSRRRTRNPVASRAAITPTPRYWSSVLVSALPRPLICGRNHFQVVGVFTRRRPKPPRWPAPLPPSLSREVAVRDLPLPPKPNNHLACRWHHQPARPSCKHAHTHGSGQDMCIMWRDRRLHIRSPVRPSPMSSPAHTERGAMPACRPTS